MVSILQDPASAPELLNKEQSELNMDATVDRARERVESEGEYHRTKRICRVLNLSRNAAPPVKLPVEIFGIIAEHLLGDSSYGSCAALNVTCRAVFEESNPCL